jgi:hypothetical protein
VIVGLIGIVVGVTAVLMARKARRTS